MTPPSLADDLNRLKGLTEKSLALAKTTGDPEKIALAQMNDDMVADMIKRHQKAGFTALDKLRFADLVVRITTWLGERIPPDWLP